jgi:acyl carrier protein
MRAAVLTNLREILVQDFRVPAAAITEDARVRSDLWLDSGAFLDLLYVVQRDFAFVAETDAFTNVGTVGELADFIVEKRVAAGHGA